MRILFCLSYIFFCLGAASQNDSVAASNKTYNLKLKLRTGGLDGIYLQNLTDSVIYYSSKPVPVGTGVQQSPSAHYRDIEKISIRRKGAIGNGMLIGGLLGLGTGAIIGLAEGDDPPDQWFFQMSAGEKAASYGIALGLVGTLIGGIVGLVSGKQFVIASDRENFLSFKAYIDKKRNRTLKTY